MRLLESTAYDSGSGVDALRTATRVAGGNDRDHSLGPVPARGFALGWLPNI
jgi:hypothetical protein